MRIVSIVRRVCCAAFTLSLLASTAFAQSPGTRVPVANKQIVSANPFLLMAEWANVEYERKASERFTFGASLSSAGIDDTDYRNVQGFYRYYPQGASLTGFYLGARGGMHRVSEGDDAAHVFGLGFELGYGWLFGSKRAFALSLGAGATRLFGGDLDGGSVLIPTLRLVNIGWSF
jgi:hypothetical protein